MKLIQLFSIFLMSMTFAQFAQAKGTEVGNGGHGVVCRDSSGKVLSVEVLDLYEARTLHGWTLSFGPPTLSYPDKIRIALNRLQKFSPQRATNYQTELNTFESEARFLPGVNLELLPDAANVAVPAGCNLEQIVNQRTPLVPGDPRYIINGDLWNAMSLDQKAALVLHEIVYREMIGYGHKYSISARWLVGWMTSTATETFTMKDFLTTLQDLAVKTTDIDQYTIPLVDCGVAPNEGNPDPSHDCATPQDISFKASMDFYPSGNLKTYWNSGSSLTSNAGPVTSLTLSPYVTVEMLVGDSGNATQNGWLMTDSLPPHLLNLVGSVTLMQTSPSILAANPTSYQLTSDGHIASLSGGAAAVGPNNLGLVCGTCHFASDGQISVEKGTVELNHYTSFNDSVSADSIVVDADQKLVHASGHARYATVLGSSDDDSSHQQSVQIQANTILMKNDPVASVAADQVTNVYGLSPKGYFGKRFGGDFIREFVATSPAAHIELSDKGDWNSKDLAFVLPATATTLKSVSGKPVLVRLEDITDNNGVTFATMEEVETELSTSPSSVVYLAPHAPIEVADSYAGDAEHEVTYVYNGTLSRDFITSILGENVTFKAGSPIEFYDPTPAHPQAVETGVLAADTKLKTHNIFSPIKLFKAGTTVNFDQEGYYVKP